MPISKASGAATIHHFNWNLSNRDGARRGLGWGVGGGVGFATVFGLGFGAGFVAVFFTPGFSVRLVMLSSPKLLNLFIAASGFYHGGEEKKIQISMPSSLTPLPKIGRGGKRREPMVR
jgi:hypothetical protein